MKKILQASLFLSTTIWGDQAFIASGDADCYPYGVNPPLTFPSCASFGGHIDYLYWKPSAEGNAFGEIRGITTTATGTAYTFDRKEFDEEWNSGVRLGLTMALPCNEWKVDLNWTYFSDRSFGSASTNSRTEFAQLAYIDELVFFAIPGTPQGSSVYASWKIEFDQIDLVVEREFYVGHQVTLKPFTGLRAIYLSQKVDGTSTTSFFADIEGLIGYEETILSEAKATTDYRGIGLVGGLSSTWDFFCNLGLYGDVSASILYGNNRSNVRGSISSSRAIFIDTLDTFQGENTFKSLSGTLDFTFGFEWRKTLFSDFSLFTLRAGWEEHLLFRQNTLANIFSIPTNSPGENLNFTSQTFGDISFQGLVISAALTF